MLNWIKARTIKKDLETRLPLAKFKVTVRGDDVTVYHVGGHNYIEELPTYERAVDEMVKVIRQTIPGFEWESYKTKNGTKVYVKG